MFSLQTIFGQGNQFYTLLEEAAVAAHDSTKALHAMLKTADRQPALDAFKLARQREREASDKISHELVNSFITHFERGWNSQAYQNFGREAGGEVHLCGPCSVSDFQTTSPSFEAHSVSLRFSRDLWGKLNTEWDAREVPQRAHFMALSSLYEGAVLSSFGSHLCEVALNGGPKQTAAQTLDQAVHHRGFVLLGKCS